MESQEEIKKIKEEPQKIVWVSCRADEDCQGKESVLLSAKKVGDQSAVNLVRYRCMSCGKVFSVSF